ncbi:hypothetical protein BM613_04170 [Sulfoacidibacillus thermotolerans]|uniref:Uncharacterized protein n=1 Tax=Sulfoacidibacillus thermotolerans TaxID=1765684 RepID=A0A2U3DAX1_SULT2|nr:hypothetical protein BM613_04170 [Sulfoacidibacillus thermotolerans]
MPDGFFPDEDYQKGVQVGGPGPIAPHRNKDERLGFVSLIVDAFKAICRKIMRLPSWNTRELTKQ